MGRFLAVLKSGFLGSPPKNLGVAQQLSWLQISGMGLEEVGQEGNIYRGLRFHGQQGLGGLMISYQSGFQS